MTSHERAVHTIALQAVATVQNLRNRQIEPEAGWRLVDILGAPMRAYTENPKVAVFRAAAMDDFIAQLRAVATECNCDEVGAWCLIHDK